MTIKLLLIALLSTLIYNHASAQAPSRKEIHNLPGWAKPVLTGKSFSNEYLLSTWLTPFVLQGDFNGDGVNDIAALITSRESGTRGIAILHAGASRPIILGAGHAVGNGGDDFSWLGEWSVHPKSPISQNVWDEPPPQLRGDALLLVKPESASGIVYWDGKTYRWYQQGD